MNEKNHEVQEPDVLPTKKYDETENKFHKEAYNKIWDDIWNARKHLKTRHKVLYIVLAFAGLNLCWFGLWTLIRSIPLLSNPIVSIPLGVSLLMLTGKVKDLA